MAVVKRFKLQSNMFDKENSKTLLPGTEVTLNDLKKLGMTDEEIVEAAKVQAIVAVGREGEELTLSDVSEEAKEEVPKVEKDPSKELSPGGKQMDRAERVNREK